MDPGSSQSPPPSAGASAVPDQFAAFVHGGLKKPADGRRP